MSLSFNFKGCLFDLDGTLVDSMAAVNRAWSALAERHGLDCDYVLSVIHGRPASESINELLAAKSQAVIDKEIVWLKERETNDTEGTIPIDGAIQFLQNLDELSIPWAIVTSGTMSVATARMKTGNIPMPDVLVTAEQITKGKPNPEPYLLGASKIGIAPDECIVFEDAPAGIQSGLSAKSKTIGILTHAQPEMLFNVDCIKSYEQIEIKKTDQQCQLAIKKVE